MCKVSQGNHHSVQGGTPTQNYFHQHFLSENHHGLLEDCEIRLIDKTNSSDSTRTEFFLDEKS